MAANTTTNLINLDFDTFKTSLRNYLQQQDLFKDYDFTGSNLNVLLDILSYNTFHNTFYLNMIGNEMFLDSAQIRDSVVSHAKELNYLPRSFRSARATINLDIETDSNTNFITVPKNTQFTSYLNSNTYTFSTDKTVVSTTFTRQNRTRIFSVKNLQVYEGSYLIETFTMNYNSENQRFIIQNPLVDVDSLTVVVNENDTVSTFRKTNSLLGLNERSEVYFIQACENDRYEIIFGNDILGRRPLNGAVIVCEYRTSSGELPNGTSIFKNARSINGFSNVDVTTVASASGGAIHESINDVKYYAPRHYQTQERAITEDDYEILLKKQFPEINVVAAFGGETLNPPIYGKVYITTDIENFDGTPVAKKREYERWIKQRTPLTVEPVFVDPIFVYGRLKVDARYNSRVTSLSSDDIQVRILGSLEKYINNNYDRFKVDVRVSKLIQAADQAHNSIVSSFVEVFPFVKWQPKLGKDNSFVFDFPFALNVHVPKLNQDYRVGLENILTSSTFVYSGKVCMFADDNAGIIRIVTQVGNQYRTIKNIGTINYSKGVITINDFNPTSYTGDAIKIYIYSEETDFTFNRNFLFNIKNEDIDIVVRDINS